MIFVFWVLVILVVVFAFVLLFGAPFLPTLKKQTEAAFELLDLKPGDIFLELGCGDGRVLGYAAGKGIKGIGYEINPFLYIYARARTWRQRRLVKIYFKNYWKVSLPKCDGIYVFLLENYMAKLDEKIKKEAKGSLKLVSYAFKVPFREPDANKHGMYLYRYEKTS